MVLILVLSISILQNKRPTILPDVLRNWNFLPKCMRSLEPYDTFVMKYLICCKKLKPNLDLNLESDVDVSFVIQDPIFGEVVKNSNGKEIFTVSNLYHVNKFAEISK